MQKQAQSDTKGLLVVSFGTTHEETRKKTIDAIEQHLAEVFPDRRVYRGWTSRMILRILQKRTGSTFDTVEEALDRMAAEGIRDVLVQPTHIIGGEENEKMRQVAAEAADRFDAVTVGPPLLETAADLEALAQILAGQLLQDAGSEDTSGIDAQGPGSAGEAQDRILLLMGHGSADKPAANQVYHDLQACFQRLGYENVLVATVEGTPSFEDALAKLGTMETADNTAAGQNGRRKNVVLAPLMIVAGDHAKNDMAGEDEDSWKHRLQAAGFDAVPVLKGLGEYPQVRDMIARHAQETVVVNAAVGEES